MIAPTEPETRRIDLGGEWPIVNHREFHDDRELSLQDWNSLAEPEQEEVKRFLAAKGRVVKRYGRDSIIHVEEKSQPSLNYICPKWEFLAESPAVRHSDYITFLVDGNVILEEEECIERIKQFVEDLSIVGFRGQAVARSK